MTVKEAMMEQLKRIAAFLNQYVQPNEGSAILPANETYIKAAIEVLITDGVMTAEEIKAEALEEYSVIIPFHLFPLTTANCDG